MRESNSFYSVLTGLQATKFIRFVVCRWCRKTLIFCPGRDIFVEWKTIVLGVKTTLLDINSDPSENAVVAEMLR